MPRQSGIAVTNDFRNGLITEASGLNFPESACTETYDCIFNLDGSVNRRLGYDFELDYSLKNLNRTDAVVTTYLWRNVSGNGDVSLLVKQVGATIYFYKTTASSISSGAVATTVTLTPVSGAPSPSTVEAQFSDGNGLLFVTHPFCEPFYVSYDTSTDTATATNIIIQIRDFEGAPADPYGVDTRPTSTLASLNVAHKYNLYNQGWNTTNLTAWDTSQTTMPSNADVMWRFKNSSDAFDMAVLNNVVAGNSKAPNGHFILNLYNQDRDTAAGTSGVVATVTGAQRPATSAFFAGRVFYAGLNAAGFNSKIYFTQIIENTSQYGYCYQVNDPTAEDTFDLLPSDGGVISIPDAGTILKLVSVPGGMAVFAANGVWFVTGSTGIGFRADDYTIQKITNVTALTASSFVNVAGYPAWWNTEGIYTLVVEQTTTIPAIKSMTLTTIKSFYDDIPLESKKYAKGFFNYVSGIVQWIYRSTSTEQITEQYEYDRVLNFNTKTGAWYPWTLPTGSVKVNGLFVTTAVTGNTTMVNVIDGSSNTVVDGSSNQIIAFNTAGLSEASLTTKFLVSYWTGSTYSFTFGEPKNNDYLDWYLYDTTGVNFNSYFHSGYRIRGEGLREFQPIWVRFFNNQYDVETKYYVQGIWNYANTPNSGRWTTKQLVTQDDTNYSDTSRRLKIRGRGENLQIRVSSVEGYPFKIAGWASLDAVNALP